MEEQLLGGLFEKQGLKRVEPSPQFRDRFYAELQKAREQLGDKLAPRPLILRVTSWLDEFRSQKRVVGEAR
jgi:hypothetical protein